MSSIKERIKVYIDYLNISKYQFYKETGITRGVLDSNSGITEDNIIKFFNRYPEADVKYIVTGISEEKIKEVVKIDNYLEKNDEEILKDKILKLLSSDQDFKTAFKFFIGKEINTFATEKLLTFIKDERIFDLFTKHIKGKDN